MKGQKAQGSQLIRQTCKKYTNNIISLSVSSKMITKVILAESVMRVYEIDPYSCSTELRQFGGFLSQKRFSRFFS